MQLPWLQHMKGCTAAGRAGYLAGNRSVNSSALPAQQTGNMSPARGWGSNRPGAAAPSGNISSPGQGWDPTLAAPASAGIFGAAGLWGGGIWAHGPGTATPAQARNSSSAGGSDTVQAPDASPGPPPPAGAASAECQSDAGELCLVKCHLPAASMKALSIVHTTLLLLQAPVTRRLQPATNEQANQTGTLHSYTAECCQAMSDQRSNDRLLIHDIKL